MNPRKKPFIIRILPAAGIILLVLASLSVNAYILDDQVFSISRPDSPEPPLPGDWANPVNASDYDELLSMLPGRIPILEYHIIMTPSVEEKFRRLGILKRRSRIARYTVTSDEFRSQLAMLRESNFVNISLDEYLSLANGEKKNLDRVPPGSKLCVLTFDDASFGQFDVLGKDSNGKPIIDPDSAVGIMIEFSRAHPDFRLNAAFSIDWSDAPFQQPEWVTYKLNALLDMGFEILNHSMSHKKLGRLLPLREKELDAELGKAMEMLESHLGYRVLTVNKVCYPDGDENPLLWQRLSNISYNGRNWRFIAALDADGMQARNPNEKGFNRYRIARIETSALTFNTYILNAPDLWKTPQLAMSTNRPARPAAEEPLDSQPRLLKE